MTINELCERSHATAVEKGWYEDGERNFGEVIALIHSELSEALEAAREGHPFEAYQRNETTISNIMEGCLFDESFKPEGVLIELADAVIRIADYCGSKKWDLGMAIAMKGAYNRTRPHKHGKKF